MNMFVAYLLIVMFLIVADMLWFQVSGGMYAGTVSRIQGKPMAVRWSGGVVAWMLFAAVIYYFAVDWKSGAMLGLGIYGVFNATNYALFDDYDLRTALIDTMWGVCAGAMAGTVASFV